MADDTSTSTTTTSSSDTNISSTLSSTSSTYDSTANKPAIFLGSVRTYVAGVLMPTIAVSISAAFNQFPQATVTLPADPRLYNVGYKDRVPVQIFVKETVAESPNYILMFEGFVAGKQYLSLASQREINLSCLSYAEVFKDTKINVMSSIKDVFNGATPGQNSLAQNLFISEVGFPAILFQIGLGLKTEENGQGIKYITCPTMYLANIMQYMEEAGTSHASAGRFNDSIVSQYYATLSYNLRFSKRFCWLPYFDYKVETKDDASSNESKTGLDASESSDYGAAWLADGVNPEEGGTMFPVLYGLKTDVMAQTLAGISQQCSNEYSMYDLLTYLLGQVEYDFMVIPTPAFHAKGSGDDEGEKIDQGRATTIPSDKMDGGGPKADPKSPIDELDKGNASETIKNLQKKYERTRNCDRMVNFCMKPMFDDTFPPKCNIIFRSQVLQISVSQQYNQVPTRIQVTGFDPFLTMTAQNGGSANALHLFSDADFYPSDYFADKYTELSKDGGVRDVGDRAIISEKLDNTEKYTGPWIVHNQAPGWVHYAWSKDKFNTDNEDDRQRRLRMREQYMRRQLLRSQILSRTLNASCVFLPYITCGFPAAIYDSAETGFSFAGNVIAYEHQINAAGMSTSVTLNGVRLLAEAIAAESQGAYPNPINCVHAITHNVKALNKVYAAILGTPDASISGAEALDWETVRSTYSGTVSDVTQSPQTNIYEAYKIQRRNIITFDDYCSFMGLTKTPSGTDESGNPPTEITNDWVTDRAPIDVYQIVPLLQQVLPVEKLKEDQEEKDKTKSDSLAEFQAVYDECQAELLAVRKDYEKCDALAAQGEALEKQGYEMIENGADPNGPEVTAIAKQINDLTAQITEITADCKKRHEAVKAKFNAANEKYKATTNSSTTQDSGKDTNQLFNTDVTGGASSSSSSSASSNEKTQETKAASTVTGSPVASEVRSVLKEVAEDCWANTIY